MKKIFFLFLLTFNFINAENKPQVNILLNEFQNAILRNDIATLEKILKKQPKILYFTYENKNTWLHLAVQSNNYRIFEYFVNSGLSLQTQNLGGSTPIHLATKDCNKKMILFPINNNLNKKIIYDYDITNIMGYNPLMTAISYKCSNDIVTSLIKHSNLSLKTSNGNSIKEIISALPEEYKKKYLEIEEIANLFEDE
jgi:ankyrin repeat protein